MVSHCVALLDDLELSYRDADGRARLLYFDRQYNETFALLHESTHDDSVPLTLDGIDARAIRNVSYDVRSWRSAMVTARY